MHVLYNVVDARPLKVASVVKLTEHRAGPCTRVSVLYPAATFLAQYVPNV